MDATEIRKNMQARLEELRPLVAEHARLEEAEKLLGGMGASKISKSWAKEPTMTTRGHTTSITQESLAESESKLIDTKKKRSRKPAAKKKPAKKRGRPGAKPERKAKAIARANELGNVTLAAKEFGVTRDTLRRWMANADASQP